MVLAGSKLSIWWGGGGAGEVVETGPVGASHGDHGWEAGGLGEALWQKGKAGAPGMTWTLLSALPILIVLGKFLALWELGFLAS